jgi:hypothetical protein
MKEIKKEKSGEMRMKKIEKRKEELSVSLSIHQRSLR